MSDAPPSCPVSGRLVHQPGEPSEPRVEHDGKVWRVRSAALARELLRQQTTTQAGFLSETVRDGGPRTLGRLPILFMDGAEHRAARSKIARFFAPRTVSDRYRQLMEGYADEIVAEMEHRRNLVLDPYAMQYSVLVAAQVLGLTNSNIRGMARRLNRFFSHPPYDVTKPAGGRSRFQVIQQAITGSVPTFLFMFLDVRPAVRARRKARQEDVISHLIDEGYTLPEILTECITFGAAGMVTTREFIAATLWHFLTDDALRTRYLAAEEPERFEILHEILRLEPVVGHLYRRVTTDAVVDGPDGPVTIKAGELIDISVRQANTDPDAVGADPDAVCPGRPIAKGFREEVMSFGDGAHRCPGNSLAIQETDILMTRLLRRDLMLVSEPTVGWDDIVAGYELRDFRIRVGNLLPDAAPSTP